MTVFSQPSISCDTVFEGGWCRTFRGQSIIDTNDRPASLFADCMAELMMCIDIADTEPTAVEKQHHCLIRIVDRPFLRTFFIGLRLIAANGHITVISIGYRLVFPVDKLFALFGKGFDIVQDVAAGLLPYSWCLHCHRIGSEPFAQLMHGRQL